MSQYLPGLSAAAALGWLILAGLTVFQGRPLAAAAALAVAVGFGSQALPAVRANTRLTRAMQGVMIVGVVAWLAMQFFQ